jgi:hypothetical protein
MKMAFTLDVDNIGFVLWREMKSSIKAYGKEFQIQVENLISILASMVF